MRTQLRRGCLCRNSMAIMSHQPGLASSTHSRLPYKDHRKQPSSPKREIQIQIRVLQLYRCTIWLVHVHDQRDDQRDDQSDDQRDEELSKTLLNLCFQQQVVKMVALFLRWSDLEGNELLLGPLRLFKLPNVTGSSIPGVYTNICTATVVKTILTLKQ